MTHEEIRKTFKVFFESRNHKWVESSSLLPADPSVLFTTAGMQQFKPYFMGTADPIKDFGGKNVASVQKAMRTSDIDEVGDKSHLTFFEMLGHFSFGDYFKKETIGWTYEFLTKELKIDKNRISATVFAGDTSTGSTGSPQASSGQVIPFDSESYDAWAQLIPREKIKKGPREDNVWGPAGPEGPCGAANEVYVDDLEVATLVFMEYYCDKNQNLKPLPQKGVDVGWGLERIVQIVQGKESVFDTDLLNPVIKLAPMELDDRLARIIADHSRAIVFLITDGVRPSNKEQGYVMRRLMRRVITYFHTAQPVDKRLAKSFIHRSDITVMHDIFAKIVEIYGQYYPELSADIIIHEFDHEKEKFEKTLTQGLRELAKIELVSAEIAFKLYESYGLPFEVIKELGREKTAELAREDFDEEFKKHQEKSRAGAEKKFGGHGMITEGDLTASTKEEMVKKTRLHPATHLLHAALRKTLASSAGGEVKQQGSDITLERLRFDFTFPRKLTPDELKQAEDMVNDVIEKRLPVVKTKMSYEDAVKSGALAFFKQKYPNRVTVYTIGPKPVEGQNSPTGSTSSQQTNSEPPFSRELCGGPHVSNTSEIGNFKIIKEESISAGVRRIRAAVE